MKNAIRRKTNPAGRIELLSRLLGLGWSLSLAMLGPRTCC